MACDASIVLHVNRAPKRMEIGPALVQPIISRRTICGILLKVGGTERCLLLQVAGQRHP